MAARVLIGVLTSCPQIFDRFVSKKLFEYWIHCCRRAEKAMIVFDHKRITINTGNIAANQSKLVQLEQKFDKQLQEMKEKHDKIDLRLPAAETSIETLKTKVANVESDLKKINASFKALEKLVKDDVTIGGLAKQTASNARTAYNTLKSRIMTAVQHMGIVEE